MQNAPGRLYGSLALSPLPAGEGQGEGPGSQQNPAHLRKFQIRFPSNDMIRQTYDPLPFGFIAHFRPAEDDRDVRPHAFDGGDDFRGFGDVPDINAKAD